MEKNKINSTKIKLHLRKQILKFFKRKKHAIKSSPFNQYVLTNYKKNEQVIILLHIPEKQQIFFNNFFGQKQVLYIDSMREFEQIHRKYKLVLSNITIYTLCNTAKRLPTALELVNKYKLKIVHLQNGLIDHPNIENLTVCFLNSLTSKRNVFNSNVLTNTIKKAELSPSLLEHSAALRKLYIQLKIGRGLAPTILNPERLFGPKLKKRVLIICPQLRVSSETGLPIIPENDVTNKLLNLAISENPQADIYLFTKRRKQVKPAIGKIKVNNKLHTYTYVSTPFRSIDLIELCDHVYTHNSLDATDAIFYGKKLTVTGSPFYAGWGLTDDRSIKTRGRILSVEEFFAIIFFKCTLYANSSNNPALDLLSTMIEIAGEYGICRPQKFKEIFTFKNLCISQEWPLIFDILKFIDFSAQNATLISTKLFFSTPYPAGEKYNLALSAALIGVTINTRYFDSAVNALKRKLPLETLIKTLKLYNKLFVSPLGIKALSNLLLLNREWEESHYWLEKLDEITPVNSPEILEDMHPQSEEIDEKLPEYPLLTPPTENIKPQFDVQFNLAKSLIRKTNFVEAEEILYSLLLSGFVRKEVFFQLGIISKFRFNFKDAINLFDTSSRFKKADEHLAPHKLKAIVFSILGDGLNFFKSMCVQIKRDPTSISQVIANRSLLQLQLGDLDFETAFFKASKNSLRTTKKGDKFFLAMAKSCLIVKQPHLQLTYLNQVKNHNLDYYLTLASGCFFQRDYLQARTILQELLLHYPQQNIYKEAINLAIKTNDLEWSKALVEQAKLNCITERGFPIDPISLRSYYFAMSDMYRGLELFRAYPRALQLHVIFKGKYFQAAAEASGNSVLVIASDGPGDEIKFVALYPKMQALFPNKKVTFTCDPRFYELLVNSFPELTFLPVARRLRGISFRDDLSNYDQMPTLGLYTLLDNCGWNAAQEHDSITTACDLICEVLIDNDSLEGKPYLFPLPEKIKYWKNRVTTKRIKIGLCWRSSVNTFDRCDNYLTIAELKPLFDALKGSQVEFYNFQYDHPQAELDWVEQQCELKIINFLELDQFNDLSSTAALMSCMDIIISPCTLVVELASAIGCNTLIISNSCEMNWRKLDSSGVKRDVWFHNLVHIEGDTLGDKISLVNNLILTLKDYLNQKENYGSRLDSITIDNVSVLEKLI